MTTPLIDLSGVYPYLAVQQMFDPFFPKHALNYYWKSLYLNEITDEVRDRVIRRGRQRPSNITLISIRYLQGAIARVPAEATAFGDRSARFLLSIDSMWAGSETSAENIRWTRDFWDEMHPHSNGQVYFNFLADMAETPEVTRPSFGHNFERLIEIKTKYDPHNFFRLNQNIRPAKTV